MSRDVIFDRFAGCDECRAAGAFDFMGDYLCQACVDKSDDSDDETQGRLDGVTAELAAALGVLWRHGNVEARTWVFLNFPGWARTAALRAEFSSDPYVKFDKLQPPEEGGAS